MSPSTTNASEKSVFGESPVGWRVDRIRDRLGEIVGGEWGDDPDAHDEGVEIPVIRVADIRGLDVTTEDLTVRRVKESKLTGRLIGKRTVLLEKSGGGEQTPVGRAVLGRRLTVDAICSNFMAKTDCGRTISPAFIAYLLDAAYSSGINTAHIQQTTGIQNLRVSDYLNTKVAFPALPEQERIAGYLDASCAAIDAAVAAKRHQVAILDNLRHSTIYHAVTRGLDDSVGFKESRLAWVGKMPSNWSVRRIKDIAELRSGDAIQSEDIAPAGDYPVFGGNGLRGYTTSFTHSGHYILIGRQGALCGNINYATGRFWATEHAVVVTPLKQCDKSWLGELLRVMDLNQYSNAAAQPGLAVDRIKFLRLPIPPLEEQTRIAEHIKNAVLKTERIVAHLERQIATLSAYRKSLIHECVTGKRRVTETEANHVPAYA